MTASMFRHKQLKNGVRRIKANRTSTHPQVYLCSCRTAEYSPWLGRILTRSIALGHAVWDSSTARVNTFQVPRSSWSHWEILECSQFVYGRQRSTSRLLIWWSETTQPVATTTWPPEEQLKRCNNNSYSFSRRTSGGFEGLPSCLHAKESLLSGDSPLGDAREDWHVRFTSPSGLVDVQEQDALELLGNFGKRPPWVRPSHNKLVETHSLIMYSTATRRPFLPSIVECGPSSCLWVILLPIAQFISTHCLARSTFVFCSKVIHIL